MIIKENLIFKYDNVITSLECDTIFNYYKNNHSNNINDIHILPWFEENTLYWNLLKNTEIKNEIGKCRSIITNLVKKSYGVNVFPNVTTLVMWKEGKSMAIHKDNGYDNDKHILHMRTYTAVMYINDNFEGGETIIMKENSNEIEYECTPQKGSVLIFKSDESCLHGVKMIEKGERLTLSMWFTMDKQYLEN
jgi:predicted 2-oxoglutarate/Fe(II)-dependent dioxygenase YbiX